jgi:hypothetical protein
MSSATQFAQIVLGVLLIIVFLGFVMVLFMSGGSEIVSIFFSMILSPFFFAPLAFIAMLVAGILIIVTVARSEEFSDQVSERTAGNRYKLEIGSRL